MFNKEGIPFFIIVIPFLSIIFLSFLSISYYLKLSNETYETEINEYKRIHLQKLSNTEIVDKTLEIKIKLHEEEEKKFKKFLFTATGVILIFMILFTFLMLSIIRDVVKKYKKQVQNRENALESLNQNLSLKVQQGIEQAKQKDKKILEQAKLARIGSMISMIAHQWRQPLSQLSGILMELETTTRFKKVDNNYILNAIDKSDKMIEFMSNTIDDFRNFYKPDKKKEDFYVSNACKKAINIIDATLENLGINLILDIKDDKKIFGYPTEFSQVILNIISNAKDILIERNIKNPKIEINIESKGVLSIITIKDNAGGIEEKNLEQIFDPYYSTKDSSKGTGLGLYISKLIIERNMGGDLSVSNNSEGAVFKIVVAG
ncbi:sensor histidine kinase [Aliarcobacter butzleri]|uniref:sensor histidine kinase n=1 Tax=Aliarcobacter butzleri TaxID=28197 RepID=UPI00263DC1B7|nr:HAMP domain-containing sensor histidine kinase [Aliarcobacter butzleri]MDN5049582.1 HAMP domain-containing sensor histidine kinase [Aliarcobacter butzleri]MDN5056615.1 HAMP domain-containing sensor histidine kinase [Aliarcobacter butzleri]